MDLKALLFYNFTLTKYEKEKLVIFFLLKSNINRQITKNSRKKVLYFCGPPTKRGGGR